MRTRRILNGGLALFVVACCVFAARGESVDLLKKYPTRLTEGDAAPEHARAWDFTASDIFHLAKFNLEAGKGLRIEMGAADLGIGHCADGAVWAVIIPREEGRLSSSAADQPETIAHVWLRFHPGEINRFFPPEMVSDGGAGNLAAQLRAVADFKMGASWQAGGRAMIPPPKDLTADVDTKDGLRRFFVVDRDAGSAEYVAAFEKQALKLPPEFTREAAEAAFDQLWAAFDRDYAMFAIRPEVDWAQLREHYRPVALQSRSAYEFAGVCAKMLRELRDLHVWLTLAGTNVPVFDRPRKANANPGANEALLGEVHSNEPVQWAVTGDKIGYIAIYGWSDATVPVSCAEALEKMRETRGLIVDVRLNGGGGEGWAREFAGRFLEHDFTYAYSQFRNGPGHTNLTEKVARSVSPKGPWRYDRPVVLLIGQKCMSSNESFVGMMMGDAEVTTMGDHTCGSSGNPEIIKLPLDMTASVPRWIDYLPNGSVLDGRGFSPQVLFEALPGAFAGERDDLLAAALERLRKE